MRADHRIPSGINSLLGWLILGEIVTVAYIASIAKVADITGVAYVLFPELAALAYDVFTRPKGTWARAPVMLVVTPAIAAVSGIMIERSLDYGFSSVLLSVAVSLIIIKGLRSPIAPAISAGLLPIVLKEGSWWYPVAILFGTALLVVSLFLYRKLVFKKSHDEPSWIGFSETDAIEQPPRQYAWLPFFLAFLLIAIQLVKLTGLRFILFPPLAVIGYEMFAHSDSCPWAYKPIVLPVVCTLAALGGTFAILFLGTGPFSAMVAVAVALAACRVFSLYIPPAAAVSLLPFVASHPSFMLPLAVGAGTAVLGLSFYSYHFLFLRTKKFF
jgi:hypothetical protein